MSDKKVVIECTGADTKDIKELVIFQGDLKDLTTENYERLKNEILVDGFSEPVSAWENEGQWFILNGTQRLRTLQTMETEGYEIPPIPISIIKAKDIKQAARKCLAFTSQFGQMTMEGLLDFSDKYELDINEIKHDFRYPELNLEKFSTIEPEIKEKEVGELETKNTCPSCGYEWSK